MNRILTDCLKKAIQKNTAELHPQWGRYHHFSFVIQDGGIVEYATNQSGRPLIHGYAPTAMIHSEVAAYRRARGLLTPRRPWDMVNIRLNKKNELRCSRPCTCCYKFITSLGVRHIWFSNELGFARQE